MKLKLTAGAFKVPGLARMVIGPVLLTITRELWEQCDRDLALPDATDAAPPFDTRVTTLAVRSQ
jgi:hypothetical protein